MSKQLKLRRGTTAQHSTFTGASGEVTVDTSKKTVVVHDGLTPGGTPLATEAAVAGKQDSSPILTSYQTVSPSGRNRIINGDMRIDQRNGGASVTPTSGQYVLDRFYSFLTQAGKFTVQQNAGVVTPPAGFTNYSGITSTSAFTPAATDYFGYTQAVEGFNVADLAWGTANAKTVTLSFYVYSSLTGTFGGFLKNNAGNRFYAYSYTVSAANSWTYISVTIPGDTSGTWTTNNSAGIYIAWGLGAGSTYKGAAGAWGSTFYNQPTGSVDIVSTAGATFYITGVQLEKGSVATPFEHRQYGQELALCQRYYVNDTYTIRRQNVDAVGRTSYETLNFPVQMRSSPTSTNSNSGTSNFGSCNVAGTTNKTLTFTWAPAGTGVTYDFQTTCTWTASAEL